MISLLEAIIKFCRLPSTGFLGFIGKYLDGNEDQYGIFLGVAPEGVEVPYMVYDVIDNGLDQGFHDRPGIDGTCYGEKPIIRFHLFDDNSGRLAKSLTKFVNTMDTILEFDLPDGQLCQSVLRFNNPRLIAEPVGKGGKRVYHSMVTYEYRNARLKGIGS
jgi:hypothetical protein